MAKFKRGESGNPKGRRRGSRNLSSILTDQIFEAKLFGEDKKAEAIISKAIEMAEGGDTTCMRICFERIAPPRKDRAVLFDFPPMREAKDAVEAAAAIVAAVANGDLTPSEAAELTKVVDGYARVLQASEFETRLARLEKGFHHEHA